MKIESGKSRLNKGQVTIESGKSRQMKGHPHIESGKTRISKAQMKLEYGPQEIDMTVEGWFSDDMTTKRRRWNSLLIKAMNHAQASGMQAEE